MEHDKNIKEKLEKRVMQPSSNSWDRLEMMLDADENPARKKGYFRYMATASIVLLLSLTFFLKTDIVTTETPYETVDAEAKKEILDNLLKGQAVELEVVSVEKKNADNFNEKNNEILIEKKNDKVQASRATEKIVSAPTQSSRKPKNTEKKQDLIKSVLVASQNIEIASQEANKVMTSTVKAEALITKEKALESEVDMLLALVTQEDTKSLPQIEEPKSEITIDANALLAEVEQELDLSFKSKVFKRLKNGFQKAKTAVVKRND